MYGAVNLQCVGYPSSAKEGSAYKALSCVLSGKCLDKSGSSMAPCVIVLVFTNQTSSRE